MTTRRRDITNTPFNAVSLMSAGGGIITNSGTKPIRAKAGGNTAPNPATETDYVSVPPLYPRGEAFQSDPNAAMNVPDNSEPVWLWTEETGASIPVVIEIAL